VVRNGEASEASFAEESPAVKLRSARVPSPSEAGAEEGERRERAGPPALLGQPRKEREKKESSWAASVTEK
jgi:hypothetical protein